MTDRMNGEAADKNYIDTSIARSLLAGSKDYRQYLRDQVPVESTYIGTYVQMELRNGFLSNLIGFYFLLELDHIKSLGNAITVWTNKFGSRKPKDILNFIGILMEGHEIDKEAQQDKRVAARLVRSYIRKLSLIIDNRYTNTGENKTGCPRGAKIKLKARSSEDLRAFHREFSDHENCRSLCHIDSFLSKQDERTTRYDSAAVGLKKTGNEGFLGNLKRLNALKTKGYETCNCRLCVGVGDVIIALDAPVGMSVVHTDHSFDILCSAIDQPHTKLPNESGYYNDVAAGVLASQPQK